MAEKHKTKYKSPKDLEKSTKPNTRKDIKDYTADDAHGMVPNLSKGVQPLVVRKYATDVLDDVENMVPKIVDHIYKKVEDGEYSPEHARKVFEKMQLAGTEDYIKKLDRIDHVAITNSLVKPENEETLKESISKLSEEQKEQVIRKYVRNKIAKILRESYVFEQEDATDVDIDPGADVDVDTPEVDADIDVDTPEADVEVDADAEAAVDSDISSPAPTSFSGGGGSSSPSPSPTPTPTSTDTADTTSDTSSTDTVNKMKASVDSFVADIKSKLANATPIEVAPEVVQPIKDLMKGMTANKSKEFKKAIATAMRNADIKLPSPSPSNDYTEN
tara:strand:+ start:22943 stop:23935 length:993 start_codon:yes stop_codon:yes gene_type:complete